MTASADLVGEKFNKLLVLHFGHRDAKRQAYWMCACECGGQLVVRQDHLRSGRVKSCGCLAARQEGASRDLTYSSWQAMKKRCYDPHTRGYSNYGGRGITVCDRWREYKNFVADMGERPSQYHSLDRIDPLGNYEPKNCRWATAKEQAQNRRKKSAA